MRERVIRAIQRNKPDCVPLLIGNRDWDQSDIVFGEIQKHFEGENRDYSEWGFQWERKDETMGQPVRMPLPDLLKVDTFPVPEVHRPGRFDELEKVQRDYPGKFTMASLALSGFTTMTFLGGFEKVLTGLYEDRKHLERLIDAVFGFEEVLIREAGKRGVDAIAFLDDWEMQNGLMISPSLWRTVFKPHYQHQFDLVHGSGMFVYFHSCGFIYDILPDFIEIGVDVMNISQPNLYDIPRLGKNFGGTVCFCCPVSYQTTSISGTPQDIERYIDLLFEHLGGFNGGLIGYAEEYHTIGMSEENFQACVRGFRKLVYPL